jgi:beta-N-acetylhexosaminidase
MIPSCQEVGKLELNLKEKIGQLLMVGIPDTYISLEVEQLIRDYGVGGIILFERNYISPLQLEALCSSMQYLAAKNRATIPLFIAVDQEGGRVVRFKEGFTIPPAAAELGQYGSARMVYNTFSQLAKELKTVGINMDLAPVLDINTNPDNPVIGDRAYGSDPQKVQEIGTIVINALQDNGIIAVGKHFPGHGDTSLDSHTHLPRVNHDLARMKERELIPFAGAVRSGVGAIMTAHVIYELIDPDYPATLSEVIVNKILRQDLGFSGMVISDDLEMKAILDYYDLEMAAIKAIQSGVDLLLVCHHLEYQDRVYQGLVRAVQDGLLAESCLDRALSKTLQLKRQFGLL